MKTRNSMIRRSAEGGVVKDEAREGSTVKCPHFNLIQKTWEALKGSEAGV